MKKDWFLILCVGLLLSTIHISNASLGSKDYAPSMKLLESDRGKPQWNSQIQNQINSSRSDQSSGDSLRPTKDVEEKIASSGDPIKDLANELKKEEFRKTVNYDALSPDQQALMQKAYELADQHAKFEHCTDAVDKLYQQVLGYRVYDAPRINRPTSLQAGDHVEFYNGNKYTGYHSVAILDQIGPNRYKVWEQGNTRQGARISERTIPLNLVKYINRPRSA